MSSYEYLAKAEPCGCEARLTEKQQIEFDDLVFLGTGERCAEHDNDYVAIELLTTNCA